MGNNVFKRCHWKEGLIYAVPLSDETFGIAQAIVPMMPNIIYVTLFSDVFIKIPSEISKLDRKNMISLIAVTKQDLSNGSWAKVGVLEPLFKKKNFPNEKYLAKGYVGATIYDAGIIEDFLSAYHGLIPWNSMFDINYYEKLLAPGIKKPNKLVILSPSEREIYRKKILNID